MILYINYFCSSCRLTYLTKEALGVVTVMMPVCPFCDMNLIPTVNVYKGILQPARESCRKHWAHTHLFVPNTLYSQLQFPGLFNALAFFNYGIWYTKKLFLRNSAVGLLLPDNCLSNKSWLELKLTVKYHKRWDAIILFQLKKKYKCFSLFERG